MADNTVLNAGSGGDTIATDDISGVKYQRVKLALGADGTAVDATAGNGTSSTAVQRVTIASDSTGQVFAKSGGTEYETVAASQTAQALGASGATGDYISGVLVVPATVNPGNVLLLDNATSITVFTGGTASVSNLIPFFIPLGLISVSGAWKLTTGANVSCIGIGDFT